MNHLFGLIDHKYVIGKGNLFKFLKSLELKVISGPYFFPFFQRFITKSLIIIF
jgi:hypothetical protein